ncbi:MAG: hypothetical protein K8L99_17245, partial [Anaerolineae bacterium]|nr:hypothetical protein [Anaerolineae bacterium]
FQVSLKARDAGWTLDEALLALADLHVWQPAPLHHCQETPAQRYVEARKTIQSAYSRLPRRETTSPDHQHGQIPNSVREHLVRGGETRTMRLLDGLRLRGIKPGDAFTTGGALALLNGIVGRDSIYAALKFITHTGDALFRWQGASPLNPPSPANAASETQIGTNKCFIGREEKSGKSPNHRPAAVYIMPSDAELCARLGLEFEPAYSDPITLDDLSSAKGARMALHRELIRRRPGNYTRGWLARRLGVTRETIDTYTRETEGIRVRHCFWEQPIFWSNLNTLPDEIEVAGAFLQDENGKRYPPQRDIARRLLGQGKKIVYRRQDANYYWFEEADSSPTQNLLLRQAEELTRLRGAHPKITPVYVPYMETAASGQSDAKKPVYIWTRTPNTEPVKAADAPPVKIPNNPLPPLGKRHYKKPLPDGDAEYMAQKLYAQMREKSTDAKGLISRAAARRLVTTYGMYLVGQGLAVIARRKNITNPTGFLITWLRSESRRL